jgi:hypothetical protein
VARSFRHVVRAGTYYRVCGPDWKDPADTEYSKRFGGRWNAAGTFGVLYLNRSLSGARAYARHFIASQFGPSIFPEDISPAHLPEAVAFEIDETKFVDAVSDVGRTALRLEVRYEQGEGYDDCQRAGRDAYAAGENGIATKSAVIEKSEELGIFDRVANRIVRLGRRQQFLDWRTPLS